MCAGEKKFKPTLWQRFFADGWLFKLWGSSVTIGVVFVVFISLGLPWIALSNFLTLGLTIFLLLVVVLIGWLIALISGSLVLPPFYRWRERLNGAPFREGEVVVILEKPFCGRVTTVRKVWGERYQVRLDLGEEAERDFTDVYSFASLQKLQQPQTGS